VVYKSKSLIRRLIVKIAFISDGRCSIGGYYAIDALDGEAGNDYGGGGLDSIRVSI
jgi:hypothetical protein